LRLAAGGIDHRIRASRKIRETLGLEILPHGANHFIGTQAAHLVGAGLYMDAAQNRIGDIVTGSRMPEPFSRTNSHSGCDGDGVGDL
jgi:hypothetical protein